MSNYINQNLRIIFFGTPEFAAIILKKMIEGGYPPIAVVTVPDKPVGRKQILVPPATKIIAEKYKIPVFQPEKIENWKLEIENLKPDLIILAAYGQILPAEILNIPRFGCLNIHPSLLPKYRGPSPIQATILNGDEETGVTIILMDEKIDHGPIIQSKKLNIKDRKLTSSQLSEELAKLGGDLLIEILPKWIEGKIKLNPQNHSKATYTKMIKKEDGKINWQKSAEEIEKMIRAYDPWPGTYTYIKSKMLKIIKADILKTEERRKPGMVFLTKKNELAVACGKNALILKEVQLEGKRKMTVQEFLNGHPEIINTLLI
ncbi:MAG: methionyl-tRNA formyltransferase [Patescibacteria group bacterium]